MPTLVIHGDSDALIPLQNGQIVAEHIPRAKLVVLPGVGHLATWECPELLAQTVVEFLG